VRRRQIARLDRLKRRIVVVSALSFAALFGLVSQHTAGSGKRRAVGSGWRAPRSAPKQVRFFDEHSDGFAFADPVPGTRPAQGSAGGAVPPPPPPPPVAQTTVS
jgi:hypothetical protein